jgi:hypothetical protein
VLVYNNRSGRDAELLKQFEEPSWNNPVVRYLDSNGKDLIPREDGIWTTEETVARMLAALKAAKRDVPDYFQAFVSSHRDSLQKATFAMHCYWEGEAKLGAIEGVYSTRSGWKGDLEVVTLQYDPSLVEYKRLVEIAQSFDCASKVFTHSDEQLAIAQKIVGEDAVALKSDESVRNAKASDQKYFLLQSPLRHLPLIEVQATKINAALQSKQACDVWLSPRQKKWLKRIIAATEQDKNALDGFQYPPRLSGLAKYTAELTAKLAELESRSSPGVERK